MSIFMYVMRYEELEAALYFDKWQDPFFLGLYFSAAAAG
jgi:hypothetical protein